MLFSFALLLSACRSVPVADTALTPYPASSLIRGVEWDLGAAIRMAHGSDLWPCASSDDDNLYCAWGDGGGFDGDSDTVGRVSLGFARLTGQPGTASLRGANVWGQPPWAEVAATFGGKVGSMIEADGKLLASGHFWRPSDTADAVHKSGAGPFSSLAWSADKARSWNFALWPEADSIAAFLDRGPDPLDGGEFLFTYYFRRGDDQHLFLKRARAREFASGQTPAFQFYAGKRLFKRWARWSARETDAVATFADRNHVEGPSISYMHELRRYLLTAGHYPGADDNVSSSGKWGLFEASHPWGPWHTVGYYQNWGGIDERTRGDFLGFRIPSKWERLGGREIWGVYSGLHEFDSFNVVRGSLTLGP